MKALPNREEGTISVFCQFCCTFIHVETVQAELDRSTELDNTLLSQVVSGLSLDNSGVTAGAASSSGVTEIQRLIKKIQGDGVKVLSLSERLFLMQHANVAKNITQLSSASDR